LEDELRVISLGLTSDEEEHNPVEASYLLTLANILLLHKLQTTICEINGNMLKYEI